MFSESRPESSDGLGHDLATGSFEEMRVNVAFPITCECVSVYHSKTLTKTCLAAPRDPVAQHALTGRQMWGIWLTWR